METYSTEQASQNALEWCKKNKGWKRICDIDDVDTLYETWDDLPKKEKKDWIKHYGNEDAESAWLEFGEARCKVENGYITGKGEFYNHILEVPLLHNLMSVYKVG